MAAHLLSGVNTTTTTARAVGVTAIVLIASALVVWRLVPVGADEQTITVTLVTEKVGEGISTGSQVRIDGVTVGSVDSVRLSGTGRQNLVLRLDRAGLFGIRDSVGIVYAPSNLFGISEVVLRPAGGGEPLTDGAIIDVTGREAARVEDATMSALLRSIGRLTDEVLTPKLAMLLSRLARDVHAFTPLVEVVVSVSEAIADTQRISAAYLLDQYASLLRGTPAAIEGAVDFLSMVNENEYMKSKKNRALFDASTKMLVDEFVPAYTLLLNNSGKYYNNYADAAVPVLDALAAAIPNPDRTKNQLSTLLDRLDRAVASDGDGVRIGLSIDIDALPVLAPLSGMRSTP